MNARLLAVALFVSTFPHGVNAQYAEFSLSFGQSLFRNEKLNTTDLTNLEQYFVTDGFRAAGRLTLNTHRYFGHEIGYSYNRSKLGIQVAETLQKVSMTTHQGWYGFLLYALPEGAPVRPFLAGGGHFTTFYPPGTSVSYGNGVTKFGLNYGAGVKVKVAPVWGIRFDLRDYAVPKPFDLPGAKGWLHQIEASAGISLLL
ncbi:MAG: outer membrane beta-barrel protein [Bryobacteraceae bacterium]